MEDLSEAGLAAAGVRSVLPETQEEAEELAGLEEESAVLTAQWQAEKEKLGAQQKAKEQLDQARAELEIVQREGKLDRASADRLARHFAFEEPPIRPHRPPVVA